MRNKKKTKKPKARPTHRRYPKRKQKQQKVALLQKIETVKHRVNLTRNSARAALKEWLGDSIITVHQKFLTKTNKIQRKQQKIERTACPQKIEKIERHKERGGGRASGAAGRCVAASGGRRRGGGPDGNVTGSRSAARTNDLTALVARGATTTVISPPLRRTRSQQHLLLQAHKKDHKNQDSKKLLSFEGKRTGVSTRARGARQAGRDRGVEEDLTMSENGCKHFQAFVKENGWDTFRIIDAYFSACINKEAREKKALTCCCFECNSFGLKLYACLHCIYFGCRGNHINNHLRAKRHPVAVELSHGTLYCYSCRDFIYDAFCREISAVNRKLEAKDLQKSLSWQPWIPSPRETSLLLANPRRRYVRANETIGLRGLVNLGNTCFMNCIVQTLIHTPVLNDYFLSERHTCNGRSSLKCLVCEVSRLFQEFYSGSRSPLSLDRLLHLIWNQAKHLAGYDQQDAHEFFIATLDVLHRHCIKSRSEHESANKTSSSTASGHFNSFTQCNCFIDQIFTGMLQSDVVCQACKGVSTKFDPFWDISLDLGETTHSGSAPKTLIDCLERFTLAEHLSSYECSQCKSKQASTKQISLRTLPSVVSFHLKRFEHFQNLETGRKISTFISFPVEFDISPFMSEKDNAYGDFRYSLYAVVNHMGSLLGGHYTAFVRHHKDTWVKCDDSVITTATLKQVLDSEGYLLFYHKNILEYE